MDHQPAHTGSGYLIGSAGTAGWWALDQLYRHGPGWSLVPPLVLSLASLGGVLRGFINDRQARRHAEERHAAELARLRRPFGSDQLEGRN